MAPDHDPPPAYLRRGPLSLSNARERRLSKGGDPREGIQWRRFIPAAIALVTLSAFAVAVWLAYEQGVRRGLQLSPPIVRAETGPVKIPPVDAGGLDVANQDKEVFDVLVAEEAEKRVEQLLPPPDEPLPAPEPEPEREPVIELGPEPAAPEPEQQLAALGPGAEVEPIAEPAPIADPEPAPLEPELVPVVEPEPEPAVAPEPEPIVEPERAPPLEPGDLAAAPAKKPEPAIVLTPPPGVAPRPAPEPAIVLTPPPGIEPRAVPEPVEVAGLAEPTPDMLASFRIQLGSFSNRDFAVTHWAAVLGSNRAALEGLSPLVRTADLGDRGTFYRLQAGPLVSSIVAIALCDVLKTNNVDCLVISP